MIRPLGENVLVEPIVPETKTPGGILPRPAGTGAAADTALSNTPIDTESTRASPRLWLSGSCPRRGRCRAAWGWRMSRTCTTSN